MVVQTLVRVTVENNLALASREHAERESIEPRLNALVIAQRPTMKQQNTPPYVRLQRAC